MRIAIRLAAVLYAAIIAACTHGTRPVDVGPAVRAMTFNIRYGTAPDGEHEWRMRRALAFQAIRDFAPTVLGVQEALRFQLDEIGTELPRLAEIGVGRDDGRAAGEYSAILYDRHRLELMAHGTFWLSDTPEVPGSMSWGNRFVRIVTWGRFRDRATGRPFYVYNTHWDHESQPARERSAELLLARIRGREGAQDPVIVMGDFNAGEDNPAFQRLVEPATGLRDTFRALHPDVVEVATYHAFRGTRTGAKIDAILASADWEVLAAGIVVDPQPGRYASDHYPVTAVLRVR